MRWPLSLIDPLIDVVLAHAIDAATAPPPITLPLQPERLRVGLVRCR